MTTRHPTDPGTDARLTDAQQLDLDRAESRAEWHGDQLVQRTDRDRRLWRRPWFRFIHKRKGK